MYCSWNVKSWQGHIRTFRVVPEEPAWFLCCLDPALKVIFLLEGGPSAQSGPEPSGLHSISLNPDSSVPADNKRLMSQSWLLLIMMI